MATSLFNKLRDAMRTSGIPARSAEARKWFVEELRSLTGTINRKSLLTDPSLRLAQTPTIGSMYMFTYDAKNKDTLPYFDRFPLIILVEPDREGTGFYGLNLHYLRPETRAIFLDKLVETTGSTGGGKIDEKTRLRVRYELLAKAKRFREFKACYKHYLWDHITSRISKVSPNDWDIAIFLPTEHFSGAAKTKVWKESLDKYRTP